MSPDFGFRGLASPQAQQDVFPPLRSQVADPGIFMPYPTEDLALEEEYEQYLFDLNASHPPGPTKEGFPAWNHLPVEGPIGDGISDSESVVSIGELTDNTLADGKTTVEDADSTEVGKNNWEAMSPRTLGALPKSPAKSPHGRRSSSGAGLRPVMPFDLDDPGSALDEEEDVEMGPMPIERGAAGTGGGQGVDEVEYMYGE